MATAAPAIPARPLLRPWLRTLHEGSRVLLEDGDRVLSLSGGAAEQLVPALLERLDGTRRVDEIVAELGTAAAPAVELVLGELAARDLLVEGDPQGVATHGSGTTELLAAVDARAPASVAAVLASETAVVVGAGAVSKLLASLLERSGLGDVDHCPLDVGGDPAELRAALEQAGLLVAVAEAPGRREILERVNDAALRAERPWLQVLPFDGRRALIGPLFVPRDTCCHRCYTLRRAATCGYPDEFAALEGASVDLPAPPALAAAVAGLTASLALRWLTTRDPAAVGRLLALELAPTPTLTPHLVYKVPRCPACSALVAGTLPWHGPENA